MRLAILLTCFNRKEKTLECLHKIYNQVNLNNETMIKVILVDDGCTDGTGDAVKKQYPQVQVLQGTGDLFWNGGMSLAFGEALKKNYDYYIWMNDDTEIFSDTLSKTISTLKTLKDESRENSILVGATQDFDSQKQTYGGVKRKKGLHPFKFELISPNNTLRPCDTINGNFVVIPNIVAQKVGNLDKMYTHAFGDFDYGFRAKKQNIELLILPEYIGACSNNSKKGTWQDTSLTFKQRLQKRHSITGVPFRNWAYFCKKHGGILWPLWVFSPYIKMFLQSFKRTS